MLTPQGNNIVGDAANEPSIAVDPTDSNKITIGWRQFNTVSSNFRQGGWGYTTDGGVHWTFPGVLENNVFRSDPVLDSNELGTFFYLSLRGHDFVTTSGSPPTAANHGPVFRGQAEATSSGLRLIRPAGQVTGFTTSFGLTSFLARPANLAVPQTAA